MTWDQYAKLAGFVVFFGYIGWLIWNMDNDCTGDCKQGRKCDCKGGE